jgi:ABC-2 type transport system permease protein/lipopolysaccharide transport system permease protein
MTPDAVAALAPRPATEIPASRAFLKRYVELLSMLSSRTLKTRYRGSVLGVFWSLSNPLLMTAVYTLIFGTAFASYYGNSIFNYVFATFVGLATLNLFSQTTSQALGSVVNNGSLLNKVRLPISLFPMSFVASNFFQFGIGALPLLVLITLYKTHSILHVIALVIPCTALLFAVIGFSFLTSALYVYFRDLPYMYEIVLFIVTMTSPIFYPLALVPAKIQPYLSINPLVFMVGSLRQIVLVPGSPDLIMAGKGLLTGIVYMAIGAIVFSSRRRDFMDLL